MPHILVVDDDRTVLEMLADLLHDAGYTVETCRDGKSVLEMAQETPYDLIILDILIPHANGFVVTRALRQNPLHEDTPILIISGIYRSRNHRQKLQSECRILDYLDKPLNPKQILALVNKACGPGTKVHKQRLGHERSQAEVEVDQGLEDLERLLDPQAEEEHAEVEKASRQGFQTSAFVNQGSVKKTAIAQVLGAIWAEKRSGALLLKNKKGAKKIIYCQKGHAYAAKSNLISECLGQLLVKERLISADECQRSIELMHESGKRQGEVLVGMGAMTPKNLAFALELQLETKLFEPFSWDEGEYRFNRGAALPQTSQALQFKGAGVITEGIRRTYDETRLRRWMMPIIDIPLALRSGDVDTRTLGLSRKENAAFTELELPMSAREMLETMNLPPADSLRVIYTLVALGVIEAAA